MRGPLLALALALAAAARGAAADPAPVTVTAAVSPARATIGTPLRYTVEVAADPGVEVAVEQPAERIGPLDVVDFGVEPPRTAEGRRVITRWFTLVAWGPGDLALPTPAVRWRRGDGEPETVPAGTTAVTIESVLAATPDAKDIRDVKGVEPVPVDWRPYWLAAAALAALAALVWLVRRLRARGGRAAAAKPPPPPHVAAAAALAELARRRLPQAGAFVEHYTALAAIVRTYVERRFGLRAPEMTTEEFLAAGARDARLVPTHRGLLREFLTECDLVKFARHRPTVHDGERALAAAVRFVDETAVHEAPGGERAAG
jgi:hypothetical protein